MDGMDEGLKKMINNFRFSLLLFVLISGNAFAGPAFSSTPIPEEDVQAENTGSATGGGGRGIFPNGDIPGKSSGSFTLFAEDCNSLWWVSGTHLWKWRGVFGAGYNELTGTTTTNYGSLTSACGPALIVDVIKVEGVGKGAGFNPLINKTAFNTNTVTDRDKVYWVISGGNMCGASVTHTATKDGIIWSYNSKSGC